MFDPKGAKILIAEDDPGVLDLLTTRLELAGYRTFGARDGHRALEALSNFQPDAMILDLNMPHLDGFGVLTELNRRPSQKQPPTLVLTARNAAADVQRCLSLGAKDYLAKPFNDAVLVARVARLVRTRQRPAPSIDSYEKAPRLSPYG
jgi:DNA-binding response OmpR family regulator